MLGETNYNDAVTATPPYGYRETLGKLSARQRRRIEEVAPVFG